jgi:hypothetical protein
MIYSPQHKFLLVKNLKVGGTSLEIDLEKVLPTDAIITTQEPTMPDDYLPRNYKEYGFDSHTPFNVFEYRLPEATKDLTSVVFVRNPFDTVLSHFFMMLKFYNANVEEYKDYVYGYFNGTISMGMLGSTKNIYASGGTVQVSNVFRYEDGIENQINPILTQVGIPNITVTAKEKAWRPAHLTPQDVFNNTQLNMIKKEWAWEIKNFYPELGQ